MIAWNQNNIFAKIKYWEAVIKNINWITRNHFPVNILREAGSKLKNQWNVILEVRNIQKEAKRFSKFFENKLKEDEGVLSEAGNKLKN